ncbi:MAG: isoprenylcysteine carboxylmethyltransferase family protein [Candidatus Micrarchaeota archaeon]
MILRFVLAAIVLGLFFFLTAGTINYWQAWLYCAVILIPVIFVVAYFLKNDPAFLERRMRMKEKIKQQKQIIKFSTILFAAMFILPGLDIRFGWSNVPSIISIIANAIVLASYLFIFLVFKENTYASRIIEVEKNQKVITTGPYSIVRHPMYLGVVVMYLATPIALGSYWAMLLALPIPFMLALRLVNEEKLLLKKLKGYKQYASKVKYRIIPFIW